ncbi:MAG: hypothetical protein JO189_22950 [Deltaproteobacteria bacterium]|nr:hypothetical protein [Deltaproteobacteria bacterium]
MILWVHVLCGVVWVGVCATFILAAAALAGEPNESYAFAIRSAPRINRLCAPLAIAIPITGIGNLLFATQAHGSVLPAEFLGILVAKVGLLAIMVLGLLGAWRAVVILKGPPAMGVTESWCEVNIRQIIAWYGLVVGSGIVALGLGLWLSGT